MMSTSDAPTPSANKPLAKILVVDDDDRLRDLLRRFLSQEGFDVVVADGGKAMDKVLQRGLPDLLVLDLMMPEEDGLSILKRLRVGKDPLPVIMLTAKGSDSDRIAGLESGADDYLPKPFNPRELLARIQAVLRRRPPLQAPASPSGDKEILHFGPYTLDLGSRTLRKGKVDIPLTSGEFAMLKVLALHPHQTLSRDRLAQLAKGRDFEAFDRSLDVQVSRLRKLLNEEAGSHARYIQTVWGIGYVFVPDGQAKDSKDSKDS